MSETLLIHYNIDDPHRATWSLCNDAGELTGKITLGTLTELSEAASTHPVVVLLNSQCLHINQLKLPTQNLQKMLKAVPFAIEEFIADDIENFHFVIAKNKHADNTAVVGIDRSVLQNIIDNFRQAGISVERMIPDALCLAAVPASTDSDSRSGQWACLNYKDESYLQTAPLNGMLINNDILPYLIHSKLEDEQQTPPAKILAFCEQESTDACSKLADEIDDDEIETVNVSYNTHPLVVFCGNYKQALPLNLLQNEFKPKRKTSGYWHHWRLAASLAAVWLVLHLGLGAFKLSQLKAENQLTKAKIEKIYKKAFPQSRKIVNPRVQMEQKLKELKSGSGSSNQGLIFLLAESFGTLGSDKNNIDLKTLTFRNNRMDIGLEGSNLQAIENLNNNLNKNTSIKSEISSSSSEKNKVKGNLRIESRS
jgi:general secretion pathway protein L